MDKNERKATYRKILRVTGVYKRRTRSIREEKAAQRRQKGEEGEGLE